MRLFLLFLLLVAMVLIPFFIWEETLMAAFSQEGSVGWLQQYGIFAWGMGIVLLIADLVLPIPATLVIAALGYMYGPFGGGLLGATGSFLSGATGYWLCRLLGEKAALWLLGEKDYARGRRLFTNAGDWMIVLSRWLPVFPEVIACMAGLTRMPPRNFHLALAVGSLPVGYVYAFIGHAGTEYPVLALVLSGGLPPLIWIIVRGVFKKRLGL